MANIVDDILDIFKGIKGVKPQNILSNFDDYFASATSTLTKDLYGEVTDTVYDEVKSQYQKNLKGTSFWDKKRNQQLVYDGADSIHGGHNFYTREGTMFNVSDSDVGDLTIYKGKNKLDHATLEGYSNAMMDLEYMDDRLKYKDPDKYYTNVKNKINEIDAYEKKIGQGYKNFKGNKDYHKRRGWLTDDVNKHFGSEVLSTDPFKQTTTRNTSNNTRTNTTKNVTKETVKNTTTETTKNNTRRKNERNRQDRTRNNSQQNVERRNNQRRNTNRNTTKNNTVESNVKNVDLNPTTKIDKTLDEIVSSKLDGMSTGNRRYIKNQQAKAWKKEMVKPKNVSWSYYDDMKSTIKGIHEYAKTVPKPIFPLNNNASPEEIQKAIQQYNVWNSAQNDSRSLKFLGRDLKQNQERFERAQANIDDTIKRQRKMEDVEKEYQEWKQKQQIDKDHAEAIEMNKQYNMQDEAYKMNEMYDSHTEAIEMNRQYDIDRQQNPNRVYDVNKAWDEAIDEDVAREMARQQQLEKELPDIFKNNSNNQNVIPNKDDVINVGPDDFEIINPGNAPEEIVGGNLEIINNNNMNSNNTPPNTPKDRAPKMDNAPKNEVVVYNQNTKVGNSRLNVDDVDDNIIEGTFRVLDDADDAAKIKMPGKASMLGTAGAVIGAISDYKDARRKGHGVISSGLRAAGSFVLGEMIGWKGQLALMAVKALPSAAIKGTSMLYQENRRMNSAANQGVFGGAQFQDTQQLATMRQSGMEMAKMSQYNLQQTLMGNEATYLHR